jgi:hypothetical protein
MAFEDAQSGAFWTDVASGRGRQQRQAGAVKESLAVSMGLVPTAVLALTSTLRFPRRGDGGEHQRRPALKATPTQLTPDRAVGLAGRDRLSTRPAQEVDDQVCRRLRLLFRDPVSAIRDDHMFDVISDKSQHSANHRAKSSFATQG